MGRVGTDLGLKQADVAATDLHPTPQASQPTGGARIYPTPSSAPHHPATNKVIEQMLASLNIKSLYNVTSEL